MATPSSAAAASTRRPNGSAPTRLQNAARAPAARPRASRLSSAPATCTDAAAQVSSGSPPAGWKSTIASPRPTMSGAAEERVDHVGMRVTLPSPHGETKVR